MVETFACSFTATELEARSGISAVVDQLRGLGLPTGRVDEVQIVLAEAVNNVVEHAYAGHTPGDVNIHCNLASDRLTIYVQDAGAPLPDHQLPMGAPQDLTGPVEDLPEGGFGWFLIHELTSDIHYERSEGHNNLQLSFEIQVTHN